MDPCQRWRERRGSLRPGVEPIDPTRFGVEEVGERDARAFVVEHHYSGSYPASRLRVGLFRTRAFQTAELVGVAVFSVPPSQAVVPKWTGLPAREGVELGRFVLLDDVEGNGESWFLARAFRVLRDRLPEVRAVVAFSDPVPRVSVDGRVVLPGHVGTIYQAHNGRFVGRTEARRLVLAPDGRVVSARALSKLRTSERGAAYAYEQLVAWGAPTREPLEPDRAYVKRALREGPFRRLPPAGNLAYVWPVGPRSRAVERDFREALPYVKQGAGIPVGDSA